MPQARLGVHEGLCACEGLRRAALDEVARERERRARKADQGDLGRLDDRPDGLEHVGEMSASGSRGRSRARSSGPRNGWSMTGPRPGHYLDSEPDGGKGHDDVGEQDGRVDAVTSHGLHRELGGELRIGDRLEDVALAAKAAVLGQRPPGLAHEPHRRALHRRAPAGPQKGANPAPARQDSIPPLARATFVARIGGTDALRFRVERTP